MLNRKGQNVLEYSILIALVVGAAIAMQTYVKRGLQGRVKNAVDHVGQGQDVAGQVLTFTGDQYEPYYAESHTNTDSNSQVNQVIAVNGDTRNNVNNEQSRVLQGSNAITHSAAGQD
jgi:uncharacterized protein (UPF0333 family)